MNVDAGNLVLDGIFGGKINMRCGMGNLEFKGSVTGSVNLDCGMGSVNLKLKGDPKSYSYDAKGVSNIDCGMGAIKLELKGNEEEYSHDAKVGLGDFKFNNNKQSGVCKVYASSRKQNHFSVNCGMGSVNIKIEE